MCWPKGSGVSGLEITLASYGIGNRPIINGGTNEAAIKLLNQQYWVILENNAISDIEKMPTNILGAPNGIWTWRTNNAIVRFLI